MSHVAMAVMNAAAAAAMMMSIFMSVIFHLDIHEIRKCYAIQQNFLPLQTELKQIIMGNKALKIFYAAFMTIILVSLIVFMVIHVRAGLDGQYAKILLAGYVLLILWAALRIFNLVKSIIQK